VENESKQKLILEHFRDGGGNETFGDNATNFIVGISFIVDYC